MEGTWRVQKGTLMTVKDIFLFFFFIFGSGRTFVILTNHNTCSVSHIRGQQK